MEEDIVEDPEDHPFMRDGSVDTVLTAQPRLRRSSPSTDSSINRRSWEEHSEEETLELQDLPRSITPQSIWKDDVAIDVDSDESKSEDEGAARGSDTDEDEGGNNNWEVTMLAQQLEARRKSSESSRSGS